MSALDDTNVIHDGFGDLDSTAQVPSEFVTGAAGTGKTYQVKERINTDPKWGILTATTGIAAINLGASTLNSVLKYFDTDSLRDRFNRGGLTSTLHGLGRKVRNLVIDEVSMLDSRQLDYLHASLEQVNNFKDMKDRPMGLVLTGDFCQLPPVNAPWAFEAACWPEFEANTSRLTKIWRQEDLRFLEAINAAREGRGNDCALILKDLGVSFLPSARKDYEGSTILAKNDEVDRFNYSALLELPGEFFGLKASYWGQEDKAWRKNIPEVLKLKLGAYVMILNNGRDGLISYANGDCGHIINRTPDGAIHIKLVRNKEVVKIYPIVRSFSVDKDTAEKAGHRVDPWELPHVKCSNECGQDDEDKKFVWGEPSYNCGNGTYNVGGVRFYPLRAAYATTVFKSQGLTLDQCQIDVRNQFFSLPGMAYVALSRCRSPQGLTIVGSPMKLAERIKIDERVRRWL